MEWPDPALKVRDRARFAHSTACSPRLCDDACRVPAELGARGATAPAREGAGAAAAGGRTARQPAQQRPAQRPPAQQPEQPVRALRGEYCRPAALRRPGGSTRSNFASRARAEAPAARARPAASRRRRNMAYSTALEEEEEAGWQCCMPPRGSFGVLSPSQGAAEGVRSRDNPPPQPRPVEAHLGTAMRSPLGAPGGRSKVGRAPRGGGLACSTPSAIGPDRCFHRGSACTRSEPRALGAKCSVTLAREGDTMGNPRFLCTRSPNGRGLAPIGTGQHQICLVRPFLSRKAIFFWVLWAP